MTKNKIIGKTYSLYWNDDSTDAFYEELNDFVKSFLNQFDGEEKLLEFIRKSSMHKRRLRKEINTVHRDSILKQILFEADNKFSKYFTDIDTHLKNLPLSKKCGSTLNTSREQYLLHMIEIELVNRINKANFNLSETKYAFLPHCLHDLEKECLSVSDGTDYVCKNCSKNCSINRVSKMMRSYKIKAYIWKEADLKKVFNLAKSNGHSVGAFGIACIPELVNGLRLCAKYDVPAIGVPLDANRCRRWMEDFYPNSVNEKKILSLLA